MKTIALVFLSLFLTKSCQPKNNSSASEQAKQTTENAQVAEVVKTENFGS